MRGSVIWRSHILLALMLSCSLWNSNHPRLLSHPGDKSWVNIKLCVMCGTMYVSNMLHYITSAFWDNTLVTRWDEGTSTATLPVPQTLRLIVCGPTERPRRTLRLTHNNTSTLEEFGLNAHLAKIGSGCRLASHQTVRICCCPSTTYLCVKLIDSWR